MTANLPFDLRLNYSIIIQIVKHIGRECDINKLGWNSTQNAIFSSEKMILKIAYIYLCLSVINVSVILSWV